MSLEKLHAELLANDDYRAAYAEEDLIHRVALHVLQLREASGLSQQGLADLLGTKQPDIAKIEAGGANLTLRRVARLAYVLGFDPEVLVSKTQPVIALNWDEELADAYEYSAKTTSAEMSVEMATGAPNSNLSKVA